MERSDSKNEKIWLKKWEGLTQKSGKDWPEKMQKSDAKMSRTDMEKWEGLIWKVRTTDSKNGKVWL